MQFSHIRRCLEQLVQYGVFTVVLTGGEPLMHRRGLAYSLSYLQGKPLDICLNTSLSVPLTPEDISVLKGASFVLVSFPSSDRTLFREIVGAETYDTVVVNLEKLSEARIPFGINQVVTRKNKDTVRSTACFVSEHFNVGSFAATPAIPVRASMLADMLDAHEIEDLANELLRLEADTGIKADILECLPPCLFPIGLQNHRMAKHGCAAGVYTLMVGANGQVRECAALTQSYGSLFEDELPVLWNRLAKVARTTHPLCDNCWPGLGCEGGCKARALLAGHDPYICGKSRNHFVPTYARLNVDTRYRVDAFRYREEGGSLLISNGGSHVLGNHALLEFMSSLQDNVFSPQRIREDFGQEGERVFTYLLNKGLCKEVS